MVFRRQPIVESAPVADDPAIVDDRRVEPQAWSPAQLVGIVIGIGMTVLGIAAVARTGFHHEHIYTPHLLVWHLPHSPLLAVSEIGFGVLMLAGAVFPAGERTLMSLLGAISLAFGIAIVTNADSTDLTHWFGVTHRNGWFFVIVGGVALAAALFSPIVFGAGVRRRTYHRHRPISI